VVLSPGPETPQKAGNLLQVINYYVYKVPVLGICLGHQALGMYFGATLTKAIRPMHGKISEVYLQQDYMFEGLPETVEVVRYHSLVLDTVPSTLEITGLTAKKEVMAFRHLTLPVRGIQFHPEAALTTHGLRMISNWVKFNRIAC
jgi:anthranilate synthase component 2